MTLGYFPVVKRVCGGNFNDSSTKLWVYKTIGNHLDFEWPVNALDRNNLPYVVGIALIVWMNCYGGITKFGFRSRRRQCKWPIFYVVQRRLSIFVSNFNICKPGTVKRTVVDESLASV